MKELLISSFFSAFIGFAFPYVIKFLIFLIKRRRRDNLCASWYSYSLMKEKESLRILEGRIKISKGVFSLYKSRIYENGLLYKGTVSIENNHILMIQKTTIESRSETSCIRLDYSAYDMRHRLHGYWLSYDSDNHISCATIVLSRKKLTSEEAFMEMKICSSNYKNMLLQLTN